MSETEDSSPEGPDAYLAGIDRITVAGFKSIAEERSIEIRPLTILAGANSSGKSSIMQPLLLLKQTLEASYDPGPLLLSGPILRYTSAIQLFSRGPDGKIGLNFKVGLVSKHLRFEVGFYVIQTAVSKSQKIHMQMNYLKK